MRMAKRELGPGVDRVTVIGDTLDTDILGGVQMGFRTVLLLPDGTREDMVPRSA